MLVTNLKDVSLNLFCLQYEHDINQPTRIQIKKKMLDANIHAAKHGSLTLLYQATTDPKLHRLS